MEIKPDSVITDRYSKNIVAVSISRVLSFTGALVSTTILFRSIELSWTYDDYATIKVLTNASQVLSLIVLLGLVSAMARVVAQFTDNKKKLGETIGISLVIIILSFCIIATGVTFLGLDQIILGEETSAFISSDTLRLLWLLVVVTILPDAFSRIARSAFRGIQQLKGTMYIEIFYNTVRIVVLLLLYLATAITLYNILVFNLLLAFGSAFFSFYFLMKEIKRNGIPISFKPSTEVKMQLRKYAAVFIASSLVAANLNNVTVVWMMKFGTSIDVSLFSIAQSVVLVLTNIALTPIAIMTPHLTLEVARGKIESAKSRFREVYRAMIPLLGFSFAALFAFSNPILRVMYGADGVEAVLFLQLLSFNLIFISIVGIYDALLLPFDNAKGFFISQVLQLSLQTAWILIATPIIGVSALALLWAIYIPVLAIQHIYIRRKHGVSMGLRTWTKGVIVSLLYALLMWIMVDVSLQLLVPFGLLDILDAAIVALLAIPMWFLFMIVIFKMGVIQEAELDNLEIVLRVVPPIWWVSKPVVGLLRKMTSDSSEIDNRVS